MSDKVWGGRFEADTNAIVGRFNASIRFDRRLYREDIEGSIAHATMLGKQGIIPAENAGQIIEGLKAVRGDIEADPGLLTEEAEDIHMNVEVLLRGKIGAVAGKLHTARSRNDQVATDIRLWLKRETEVVDALVSALQYRIVELSSENIDIILPGTTHLQHAQPVRLSHHLLAYFWMLGRDRVRLEAVRKSVDVLPLGAGALAGTTFPIDRAFVAEQLGFAGITENSMDSVSDRDFVVEMLSALSLIMVHLSRLGEELILWSSPEYGYVTMGDAVTTGSSIMPQKKNPDVAEHVRGKAGRVFGSLMSLLTTMKGLPLTYAGDMQEDKEPLFDAVDTVETSLEAIGVVLNDITFNADRMAASMRGDFSTATDLADFLVTKGMPFREAHEVVGRIVGDCVRGKKALEDLTAKDLSAYTAQFAGAPDDIASVEASVERRTTPGGTARLAVMKQIELAKKSLAAGRGG
jgi:argininosuccinate lyase